MTSRLRSITRPRRSFSHDEDRQQFLVTALFAAAIALVVVILVAAVGLWYYNENLRPMARVGGVELLPDMPADRAALLQERLSREEGRVRQAEINDEIDGATMQQRVQDLRTEAGELQTLATEGLIDLVYQSQLAAQQGITVSDADIDARMADELGSVERRRVQAIFIEPTTADEEEGPTLAERRAALDRAEQALAALESGRSWAEVAAEFSTDPSRDVGGEYGIVSDAVAVDAAWAEALFNVAEGETTGIIAGSDGTYRIGRVTEILPRQEERHFLDDVLEDMPLERYRQFLAYEIAAERLRDKIIGEAVSGTPEQLRLAHVYIADTQPTGDAEAEEGEVHYSEILYAPNDDVIEAPDLPADDPAWVAAQAEADAAAAELRAITDPAAMEERFRAIALEKSDAATSGEEGGDAGFNTRGLLPDKVGEALFDTERQPGELIGPVRDDAGFYILLFHERRGSPAERLQQVVDALAQPGADFAAIARQYSDSDEADEGGELGWFSREMLNDEIVEKLFALEAGAISEPIELGNGHHVFKVLERAERELDPDQVSLVRAGAFQRWYDPLKEEAEAQGVIVRDASLEDQDLEPGIDQGDDGTIEDLPIDEEP